MTTDVLTTSMERDGYFSGGCVMDRAMLVYQAGIANVFEVSAFNLEGYGGYGRNARRLLQSDFRTCEAFARGLAAAGVIVRSCGCNRPGDVANLAWDDDFGPFREAARPVDANADDDRSGSDATSL